MKKLLLLFITTLLITSCSNDENAEGASISDQDLVGTWNVTAMNSTSYTKAVFKDEKGQSTSTETSNETSGKDFKFKYTFSKSPNKVTSSGSYTSVIKTTINGKQSVTEVPTSNIQGLNNGTWTKKGAIIAITANGVTHEAKVTSFENNVMKVNISINKSISQAGYSSSFKTEINITMEKQK